MYQTCVLKIIKE